MLAVPSVVPFLMAGTTRDEKRREDKDASAIEEGGACQRAQAPGMPAGAGMCGRAPQRADLDEMLQGAEGEGEPDNVLSSSGLDSADESDFDI